MTGMLNYSGLSNKTEIVEFNEARCAITQALLMHLACLSLTSSQAAIYLFYLIDALKWALF